MRINGLFVRLNETTHRLNDITCLTNRENEKLNNLLLRMKRITWLNKCSYFYEQLRLLTFESPNYNYPLPTLHLFRPKLTQTLLSLLLELMQVQDTIHSKSNPISKFNSNEPTKFSFNKETYRLPLKNKRNHHSQIPKIFSPKKNNQRIQIKTQTCHSNSIDWFILSASLRVKSHSCCYGFWSVIYLHWTNLFHIIHTWKIKNISYSVTLKSHKLDSKKCLVSKNIEWKVLPDNFFTCSFVRFAKK